MIPKYGIRYHYLNLIKTKYNYNINKSNFYIGYNLQKKYDKSIIIDTNLIKFLNINLIDKHILNIITYVEA